MLGHRARELEHGAAAEDAVDLADVAALVEPLLPEWILFLGRTEVNSWIVLLPGFKGFREHFLLKS